MGAIALLRTRSNAQLKVEEELRSQVTTDQEQPPVPGIANHIDRFWQSAQTAKLPIERQMLKALRQRMGIYDPAVLGEIRRSGGSEIFMMLTSAKCRAAEAWLRDILTPADDKCWGLTAPKIPEIPPPIRDEIINAVSQEAIAAGWHPEDSRIDERLLVVKGEVLKRIRDLADRVAERHEAYIEDQFAIGGFNQAIADFVYDLVTFPAAIVKGPVLRRRKDLQFVPMRTGQWHPVVRDVIRPEYERRSPFDIFPAPAMRSFRYGNFIDRHQFSRAELQTMIGVPGFAGDAIKAALEAYGERGFNSRRMNDYQRAVLELRPLEYNDPEQTIEGLDFWGSISGRHLIDWGMKYGKDVGRFDPNLDYEIEAWKVGRFVIKAALNPDPLGDRPYAKTSFEEIPGAFWGLALTDQMADTQGMCNGCARAIANNMSIASGPMVDVNVQRLADGEKVTTPYPWMVLQTVSEMSGQNVPAVRFEQPQSIAQELIIVYNHFDRQADNVSGFPNYSYGNSQVGGAGRTSSGLAQLMGNLGKGVKRIIMAVDRNVIAPIVTRTYNWNMINSPDPTIKAELHVVARGAAAILIKDQTAMRARELLQATANPLDSQIIGFEGRRELLSEVIKAQDMPANKILPDKMQLELRTAGMQPSDLTGGQGPNAPQGGTPGMTPGGGTPQAPGVQDVAGQQPNGVGMRQATQGYADGGEIMDVSEAPPVPTLEELAREIAHLRKRKPFEFKMRRDDNGDVWIREEQRADA
jgi:hypothetical protein